MKMNTNKDSHEDVRETWEAYWKEKQLTDAVIPQLASYQLPVYEMLHSLIAANDFTCVLNAGAGLDVVSVHLKRDLGDSINVELLDIAPKALALNERMFDGAGLKVNTTIGSVFQMPFEDGQFDLIFNTGLMEHFEAPDQIEMVREVVRVLKPGGIYLSANPSNKGGIYKFGMAVAKRKGTWEFGVEIPIQSLKFISQAVPEISSIEEIQKDFVGQVNFLHHVSPLARYLFWPLNQLNRLNSVRKVLDRTLGKLFGTYLLVSIFYKRESIPDSM